MAHSSAGANTPWPLDSFVSAEMYGAFARHRTNEQEEIITAACPTLPAKIPANTIAAHCRQCLLWIGQYARLVHHLSGGAGMEETANVVWYAQLLMRLGCHHNVCGSRRRDYAP